MAVFDVNLAIFDVNLAILALKTSIFGLKMAVFFFFHCKKIILLILMRWVQTTPSFLFFGSPCLRHRVLHNGSFCQLPEGKPSAPRSTSGYSVKSACILSSISFPGDMILRKYLMMHISKYTLNGSV